MADTGQLVHLLAILNRFALHFVFRVLHGRWSIEKQSIRRAGNPCDQFRLEFRRRRDTFGPMKEWISDYIAAEQKALASIPVEQVEQAIQALKKRYKMTVKSLCSGMAAALPIALILRPIWVKAHPMQ